MKHPVLGIAIAFTISILSLIVLYATQAWSRELPSVIPAYIPIGTSNAGSNNIYSTAWLLDTANQRVVICYQDVSHVDKSNPKCKFADLPKS